jgi:alpha-N-arabinofuranosidase
MRKIQRLRIKGASLALCLAALVLNGFSQSTVTFNVTGATTVIAKEIFGVLMERLGRQWTGTSNSGIYCGTTQPNTNGMRNDVINGFIECGIGSAEWPGGCAANGYVWANNKNPANDVGVDRFIQFCKLTGAEAVIAGRSTAADAAANLAFAKYIMEDLAYPLKWFKIGNEVWGCGGNQTVTTYIPNYTANYNSLKALKSTTNGKNLYITAANDMEGRWPWLTTMLNSVGATIDGVEYHDYIYYPDGISSTNPTTANYWTIIGCVINSDFRKNLDNNVLPALNTYDPNKRIKLVLDEWGDWLQDVGVDGWMQQNTVMDAVSAGSHLNILVQRADRIGVACLAQGVSVIHSVLNINTAGVMVKTPTFYVFKMFKPHHANNAKFLPMTASNCGGTTLPAVNAAASVDDSSYVNISFTNIDLDATRPVTATLTSTHAGYKVISAEVVTGAAITSCNNFSAAEQVNIQTLAASNYSIAGKVLTATLPTKSVVMFRLYPTDVAVQPGSLQNSRANDFSVKAGSRGTVLITSSVSGKTPLTISLYSVDGRTLMERVSRTFEAGNSTCVLGSNSICNGAYVVSITGRNINVSKRVIAAR